MKRAERNGEESSRLDAALVALSGCRISRPPAFVGGVEIVTARPAPRRFPVRLSEGLGVCLKIGASHTVTSDGRRLVYPADSLCVRFPGTVWSCDIASVGFVSIDIAPSLLPVGIGRRPMQFLQGDAPKVSRFVTMLETGDSPFEQEAALAELIAWLASRDLLHADALREDPYRTRVIRRAQDFLEASLAGNPSLDDLAVAAGTNKFVILRYFKREFGVGPHGYLVRLRIERARDLLARGDAPVDVAALAGFADQGHLGRHFTRVVGVTPGE